LGRPMMPICIPYLPSKEQSDQPWPLCRGLFYHREAVLQTRRGGLARVAARSQLTTALPPDNRPAAARNWHEPAEFSRYRPAADCVPRRAWGESGIHPPFELPDPPPPRSLGELFNRPTVQLFKRPSTASGLYHRNSLTVKLSTALRSLCGKEK
jgi:hypothetical protein